MSTEKWHSSKTRPKLKGWYQTKREDGSITWRAWGNGAWWKQIKGGWIEWFDGDGNAIGYEWRGPRQDIALNHDQLPAI